MSTLTFHNPEAFFLFLILIFIVVFKRGRNLSGSVIFSSISIFQGLASGKDSSRKYLTLLRYMCLSFLIMALSRPQLATPNHTRSQGIDIVLSLDISSSMLALDFSKSSQVSTRFEAVKSVIEGFIKKRTNDNIGLIAFAGNPYLVSPLTLNHNWLIQSLNRTKVGLVEDGTAIGSALAMAINRLQMVKEKSKVASKGQVIILLTDGSNNKGSISPPIAAQIAAALGIKIYTVGVGQGGIVPTLYLDENGQIAKNTWGQPHIVQAQIPVDNDTLKEISTLTSGLHFQAKDKSQLELIYQEIDKLEKHEINLKSRFNYQELFFIPLALAFLILIVEQMLTHTRLQCLP